MSPRTALRIENAATLAMIAVEYACYCVIFGSIGLGWILTSQ